MSETSNDWFYNMYLLQPISERNVIKELFSMSNNHPTNQPTPPTQVGLLMVIDPPPVNSMDVSIFHLFCYL